MIFLPISFSLVPVFLTVGDTSMTRSRSRMILTLCYYETAHLYFRFYLHLQLHHIQLSITSWLLKIQSRSSRFFFVDFLEDFVKFIINKRGLKKSFEHHVEQASVQIHVLKHIKHPEKYMRWICLISSTKYIKLGH